MNGVNRKRKQSAENDEDEKYGSTTDLEPLEEIKEQTFDENLKIYLCEQVVPKATSSLTSLKKKFVDFPFVNQLHQITVNETTRVQFQTLFSSEDTTTSKKHKTKPAYVQIKRRQWFLLPDYLTEEVWERHQFSLDDIRQTLVAIPHRLLWVLLMVNGCTDVRYSKILDPNVSRKTIVETFLKHYRGLHPNVHGRSSKTIHALINKKGQLVGNSRKGRKPAGDNVSKKRKTLDKIEVVDTHWKFLRQSTLLELAQWGHNHPIHRLKSGDLFIRIKQSLACKDVLLFKWRGICITPLKLIDESVVLIGRVKPWITFVAQYGEPQTLENTPAIFHTKSLDWALTDELFFLC